MKVIGINGSPKADGNTYQSLRVVADTLKTEGIDMEILQIGTEPISGCTACMGCYKAKNETCVLNNGPVNEFLQKVKEADGIILGSPVYFSGVSGQMKSLLDRLFYAAGANGNYFRHKVGASLVAVRRSGGVAAFDQLNHYLLYAEMLIATGNYWSVIHGRVPGEVEADLEGVHTLQVLGLNFAWAMKLIENSKATITPPEPQKKIFTHFIR